MDDPRPRDDRALGGHGGLVRLRDRVRRSRQRRAAGVSAVGLGLVCAVGVTAQVWSGPDAAPVAPPDSSLCGTTLPPTGSTGSTGTTLRVTLPGQDRLPTLAGRSLGPWVPVRVDGDPVTDVQVVLVRDDRVVAVADRPALLTSADGDLRVALETAQAGRVDGTGDLTPCPGETTAPGDYAVHAIAGDVVSPAAALTLLPEVAAVTADTPGMRADFPLADVPLVGAEVLDAVHHEGTDVWRVTTSVQGDDALQRAAVALGIDVGDAVWLRMTSGDGTGVDDPSWGDAVLGASRTWLVVAFDTGRGFPDQEGPYRWEGSSGTTLRAVSDRYRVEITEQTGPGGAPSLVYRVERQD